MDSQQLAAEIFAAEAEGDTDRALELLGQLSHADPRLADALFSEDHDEEGELDIESYPMPASVAALFEDGDGAQLAAGQPCKQGEAAARTGCIPAEGASAKESVAASRAGLAHDVIEDLGIEPGEKLDTAAYREALSSLGEAGVPAKQGKAILSMYEGGVPAAEKAKRAVLGVWDKVDSKSDQLAAPLEALGVPRGIAKTAALVAAVDMASPVTLTSLGLTAALGPVAAMKVPIYYLPGMAEAGAVMAGAVVGSLPAQAIGGIIKRIRK